jgi:catecholate siderophore receptor
VNRARRQTETLESGRRSCWPARLRWLATGTLMAYTALGSKAAVPLQAQTGGDNDEEAARPQNGPGASFSFGIAAAPLETVIAEFEQISGWKVAARDVEILGIQSPGVTGILFPDVALDVLLRGVGVSYTMASATEAMLVVDSVSTTVNVRARAQPTSPKYTAPLRDTPRTISIIPRAVIEQQGATSLTEVLRNVPGLTVVAGEGGNPAGDNLTLRGFSARNDIFVDGVRDIGPQSRDPFNIEQVEVVKGPQSSFTGRGSTGGSINMVSKTPSVSRYINGAFLSGTNDTRRGTVDINVPTPFLGERTAFRLNLLGHKSGIAGRDVVKNKRWGLAPSLAFGLGTPTRIDLGYTKLEQDNISDYGIPWVPATHNVLAELRDQPAPVPRETFYGLRDRDKEQMGSDMATVKVEHDVDERVTVRNQFRYGRSTRDSMATPPRFASPDTLEINREMRSWITEDEVYDNQVDLTARFETGAIRHTLVSGGIFTKENNIRQDRSAPNSLTTLFNPNPDDVYEGEITLSDQIGDIDAYTQAGYVADSVILNRFFQANASLRFERYVVDGVDRAANILDRTSTMLSSQASLGFHPVRNGSVYASYGTSFNPSLEGLGFVGRGDDPNLDPEKTFTTELGTKWDLFGDRLLLSGAVFRVNKTNARTPGLLPGDPPQILDGKQRVQGVELSASGSLTQKLTLLSAYTYLDSSIVETNTAGQVGNRFPQTPPHSFNLWTTYAFPWNVTLGGGARYVGRRYSNTSNTRSVPGYWTMDAMASVPVSKHLHIQANLTNASDEYYFERLGGGHLIPGAARTLMVGANFKF